MCERERDRERDRENQIWFCKGGPACLPWARNDRRKWGWGMGKRIRGTNAMGLGDALSVGV